MDLTKLKTLLRLVYEEVGRLEQETNRKPNIKIIKFNPNVDTSDNDNDDKK